MNYPEFDELIQVTITATNRKNILYKTLSSFMENLLFRCNVEAIINVDNVGESGSVETIFKIVGLFMHTKLSRRSLKPNFSEAFAFCWNSVDADWVLNLEDDWELFTNHSLFSPCICTSIIYPGFIDERISCHLNSPEHNNSIRLYIISKTVSHHVNWSIS